jgi:hypothetical protein
MDRMQMPDKEVNWLQQNLDVLVAGIILILGMVALGVGIAFWFVS